MFEIVRCKFDPSFVIDDKIGRVCKVTGFDGLSTMLDDELYGPVELCAKVRTEVAIDQSLIVWRRPCTQQLKDAVCSRITSVECIIGIIQTSRWL